MLSLRPIEKERNNMAMAAKILADIFLGVAAFLDHRRMNIPAALPAAGIVAGIAVLLIGREQSVAEVMMGMTPGSILILIAFLTHEKVGYGDGMMLLALGMLLPAELCIMSFCTALVLEAAAGSILLVSGRVSKNSLIPFLPYLLLGYIVILGVYE